MSISAKSKRNLIIVVILIFAAMLLLIPLTAMLMDMRVMILFMERRVPLNIRRIHVMNLRELVDISAYQMLPRVGVIVAQTRGVLGLQTDDMIPYISRMKFSVQTKILLC